MNLLHAGVDTTVIALWPGHADVRSTNVYLHADPPTQAPHQKPNRGADLDRTGRHRRHSSGVDIGQAKPSSASS